MNDQQERKDKSRKGGGKGRGPGGRGPGGPGRRGRGRHPEPPTTSAEELRAWFAGNLPDDWFTEPVAIRFDRDEIVVHGTLAPPAVDGDTSETLAWTVRLVVENESGWLNELREAMTSVEEVRKQGPTSRR